MTHPHPIDTDDNAVPHAVRRFLRNRLFEAAGFTLLAITLSIAVALATWSAKDPSRNHAVDRDPVNWLGQPGAYLADEVMQMLGLAAFVLIAVPLSWSIALMSKKAVRRPVKRVCGWMLAIAASAAFLSIFAIPQNWALGSGLGGSLGDILGSNLIKLLGFALKGGFAAGTALFLTGLCAIWAGLYAAGMTGEHVVALSGIFGERSQDRFSHAMGYAAHGRMQLSALWARFAAKRRQRSQARRAAREAEEAVATARFADTATNESRDDEPETAPGPVGRSKSGSGLMARMIQGLQAVKPSVPSPAPEYDRVEPRLNGEARQAATAQRRQNHEPDNTLEADGHNGTDEDFDEAGLVDDDDMLYPPEDSKADESFTDEIEPVESARVTRTNASIKPATKKPQRGKKGAFELPPLTLLGEPQLSDKPEEMSDEALDQNARILEGVLEDFGIRGEIIDVRPGPVVTLYELEPAPGIKSSRVIGLADDIARSMSAISARVAVVPGRNVIGIELPNSTRETVYLRELLGSKNYEKTKQNLALALGKNIGGEPIFADLARMPHLLIAGTTGSGKSVGINTMILSLLYKHAPDKCKLIMIDPKMLELSIYEGIPHLLAPVVTDPRKAVVALKWTVREMEERYRNMSRLGVRNIDGFNTRVKQALAKDETVSRTVQTGYDPETGEPVYEREELDLKPIPYIVVIIDEMADLMMVAGKEIEGAVQRLAQMARAAGIHVVMATQRPSVDVITGTIKANFPTRISFQVTSKIDSRTILGEMGAEQLLGQGDMLYMAGGGRISRLHAPFVADEEVEDIVKHLKSQGAPEYVEAVTEEDESQGDPLVPGDIPGGGSGNELYDQAVAVVIRDKKVSTSYIQRRLQIGYNRAASLIERMETEGLISPANHAGKREILVGNNETE